ncbi:MAG: precorrin-8X methylmutase [Lachnospiraceae bacterium]|nr:precorrin-8X methylmutase [Lachnospiraceae bacterium]
MQKTESVKQIISLLPEEIEKRSFEIISLELQNRGIALPKEQEAVTKRVIHTSADFDYADTMVYSPGAVQTAGELLLQGADIVTDTNMALAGINKRVLAKLGGEAHCFMADADVARLAKERKTTRAAVSMEKASGLKKPIIFAIGNAPTALVRLYEMIQAKTFCPAFIIGVPVGFVNVEAAKELIMETQVPFIVNRGRKGGSNIAAAVCNALLYELVGKDRGN